MKISFINFLAYTRHLFKFLDYSLQVDTLDTLGHTIKQPSVSSQQANNGATSRGVDTLDTSLRARMRGRGVRTYMCNVFMVCPVCPPW